MLVQMRRGSTIGRGNLQEFQGFVIAKQSKSTALQHPLLYAYSSLFLTVSAQHALRPCPL